MARTGVSVWSYVMVIEEPCLALSILQVSVIVYGRGEQQNQVFSSGEPSVVKGMPGVQRQMV